MRRYKIFEVEDIKSLIMKLVPKHNFHRLQEMLDETVLKRLSIIASNIPFANIRSSKILDIGGSIFWAPIYQHLGYDEINIVELAEGWSCANDYSLPSSQISVFTINAEKNNLPFLDESLDCVVCFNVLEHMAGDPMKIFKESNRILKTKGCFYLTTPNVIGLDNVVDLIAGRHPYGWSVFTCRHADRHNREYTPYECRKLFTNSGFQIDLLRTASYKSIKLKRKFLGILFCLPGIVTGRVPYKYRHGLILIKGTKYQGVIDRYPDFLYEMYGQHKVIDL